MKLQINQSKVLKEIPRESMPDFGSEFSDHMFNMDYNTINGWYNPRIEPYQPLSLDPSTIVLHFGQSIFEGLKAYKTNAGKINLFRPIDNLRRFNRSARAMCIPEFDEKFVFSALKQLLLLDKAWIPNVSGASLYIRPTIIAMDKHVGLRVSETYRFFIILSPVGSYYSEGFSPIKVRVETKHVRAVRGGIGDVKTAGNYAASLYASQEAKKEGCQQVLWLDALELKYIEEAGAMNVFFVINGELITPKLSGSILPGVTRDTIISLAKTFEMKVYEKKISVDELFEAHSSGMLTEAFGCSTAMVISPIGSINFKDETITISENMVGPITRKFYKSITDIQYGRVTTHENWIQLVE